MVSQFVELVVLNHFCHGDGSQNRWPVRVDVEPQSRQQVLQLLAMFRVIFDETDGFLTLP